MEKMQSLPAAEKHCNFRQAVWYRRPGRYGTGPVLLPADRHHCPDSGPAAGNPFLVDVGGYASGMSGSAMAVAIGYALQAPPLVLFSWPPWVMRPTPWAAPR